MPFLIICSKLVKLPLWRERQTSLWVGQKETRRKVPPAEWARQVWEGPSVNSQEPRDGDIGLLHWRPWICADSYLVFKERGPDSVGLRYIIQD